MRRVVLVVVMMVVVCGFTFSVFAQSGAWSNTIKSVKEAVAAKFTPQAQSAIDEANKLATAGEKENFLITKAKAYLGEKNYQTALDLANYVKTNINPKSIDAKSIIESAKAALAKMAKEKASSILSSGKLSAKAAAK